MGFFDKVKNMFTEEVEEDVKVEQIKKEVTQVSIESPNAKKDDFTDSLEDDFSLSLNEDNNKPVFFDDNDFRDLNLTHKVEKKPKFEEKELYHKEYKEEKKEEKKVFKPTPIISPVYGVLDKNYHKEDIVSRNEVRSSGIEDMEPSIESIRNKAYGTLEDELENTLFGNNSILFKHSEDEVEEHAEINEELNEDVLSNLTDDISKELDELLIKKEKYSDDEFKQSVRNNKLDEDDLLDFIDSTLYKDGDEE